MVHYNTKYQSLNDNCVKFRWPWLGQLHGFLNYNDSFQPQEGLSSQGSDPFSSWKPPGNTLTRRVVKDVCLPQVAAVFLQCFDLGSNQHSLPLSCKAGGRDLKGTQVYPGGLGLEAWSPDRLRINFIGIDTYFRLLSFLFATSTIPNPSGNLELNPSCIRAASATILHVLAVQSSHGLVRSDRSSTLMFKTMKCLISQVRWQWSSKMKKRLMMTVA